MELQELVARESIRDLVARYARCADAGRFGELAELFAANGSLEIEGRPPARGHAAILELLEGARAAFAAGGSPSRLRHHVSSVVIDLVGSEAARASGYFLVIGAIGPEHWGSYRDDFGREDGTWRFVRRRVRVEGYAPGSVAGAVTREGGGSSGPSAE